MKHMCKDESVVDVSRLFVDTVFEWISKPEMKEGGQVELGNMPEIFLTKIWRMD